MNFHMFCKTRRLTYRNSALRRFLNLLRSEPIFHYKRSSRGPFCLLGPRCEHRRGHMPVNIGLLESSHMTCPKTKLRELSLWHAVSLHVCSTSLFLNFKDDISNHRITLATATFSKQKTNKLLFQLYLFMRSSFLRFSDVLFDDLRLDETSAVMKQVRS